MSKGQCFVQVGSVLATRNGFTMSSQTGQS